MAKMYLDRRRLVNAAAIGTTVLFTGIALVPLVSILGYVAIRGLRGLDLAFFTQLPAPVGEPGGGMANAFVGTLIMVTLASLISIPIGIMAGIYLSEFGRGRFATLVRFVTDVATGIPSIIAGIFIYSLVVLTMGRFSGLAGGLSLGVLMIPVITRTTEEMLRLVPQSLREAALALGVPYWKVILQVVLPAARSGIMTGTMLAIARAAGETAPLLFTSLGNQFWQPRLDQPMAALPIQIFTYAVSPYEDWHQKAWAGAALLILLVVVSSMAARLLARSPHRTQ